MTFRRFIDWLGALLCVAAMTLAVAPADAAPRRAADSGASRVADDRVNTPPTISDIADQRDVAGRVPAGIGFRVSDAETPAGKLQVSAASSNPQVVPDAGIRIDGDGELRILTAESTTARGGTVTITVAVSDGLDTTSKSFVLQLGSQPTLFVCAMTPQATAQTLGSGQATLLLAADELSATLRFNYSNLTGPETAAHIHGPADPGQAAGILFDIDTATPNPDGSYTWTFEPVGGHSIVDQVNFIRQGKTYINIHTAAYPNGEIRGQFQLATGSQTFTPPAPPPNLPNTPPTDAEAARFLTQATFGVTPDEIMRVRAMGYEAWIEDQFRIPQTNTLDQILQRIAAGERADNDNLFVESWWSRAITAPDQLRHRVAFALSQIFVISQQDGDINNRPREVAYYYDLLARNAFGNYRTLLEEVTLNPEMGQYLDMRGSKKAVLSGGQLTRIPNENYPREVLQLFSIGLYRLHPDGTLKLGETGLPIETYGQNEIVGLSRVFSGWNWNQAGQSTNPGANYFKPMTVVVNDHDFGDVTQNAIYGGPRILLDGVVLPARQASVFNARQDLADALNQLYNHANTGPFICKQLIQRLVTSNPSPGYVYRTAQVFQDNGQGVRGDLKAVIKAILLDYEARAAYNTPTEPNKYPNSPVYTQGFGKVREPILRATAMIRPFRPYSASGYFRISSTDATLGQSPMRAPTVFNFFEPGYSQPGAIAQEGLVAPELQILSEITVVNAANFLETGTRTAFSPGGDIRLDFSVEQSLAGNIPALLDRLDLLLMYGQMSKDNDQGTNDMRQRLSTHLATISAANPIERVRAAVHLIVTSPEFGAQR